MKKRAQRTAGVGAKAPAPVAVKRSGVGIAKIDGKPPFSHFFDRWSNGEKLADLAAAAGIKRSKFRRLMIAACGGKAAFAAARAEGAGGDRRVGAAHPRMQTLVSDENVKFLKNVGWRDRNVWVEKMVRIKVKDADGRTQPMTVPWRECVAKVFISPKGNEYVRALPSEKADARLRCWLGEMESIVRLKRYVGSKAERRVEATTADAEQLAAKVAHIQAQDKAKRVTRRKARLAKRKTKRTR